MESFHLGKGDAEGHQDGSRTGACAHFYEGQVRSSFHLGKGEGEGLHEGSATDARAQFHIIQVMESFHLGDGQGLHRGEEKGCSRLRAKAAKQCLFTANGKLGWRARRLVNVKGSALRLMKAAVVEGFQELSKSCMRKGSTGST